MLWLKEMADPQLPAAMTSHGPNISHSGVNYSEAVLEHKRGMAQRVPRVMNHVLANKYQKHRIGSRCSAFHTR